MLAGFPSRETVHGYAMHVPSIFRQGLDIVDQCAYNALHGSENLTEQEEPEND